MNEDELIAWLLEHGGPAVRYRTATELLESISVLQREQLVSALLASPPAAVWLERLQLRPGAAALHHSACGAFENTMGKLAMLGCRKGMAAFDEKVLPFREWLSKQSQASATPQYEDFYRNLVAAYLAMAGYEDDPAVRSVLESRLDTVSRLAVRGDYKIFIVPANARRIPLSYRHKRLVNPLLTAEGIIQLPLIHDMYGFACLSSPQYQTMIGAVVGYIMHMDYQNLHCGDAIGTFDGKRFWSVGWDVTLPGFFHFDPSDDRMSFFVQRLELMARFAAARAHRWLRDSLAHLEGFRTERGTYLFPASYLEERPQGYWVKGAHMALEAARSKTAREIESTFWMLRIRKLLYTVGKDD